MKKREEGIPNWAGVNNDGRYYYYDGLAKGKGKRVQRRGGRNREEALITLREVLADLQRGYDLNIDIDTTWAVLLQKWVETHDNQLPEGTLRTRKSAIDSRILPAIGSVLLVQTDITTLTKVVDFCVSKGTVNSNTLEGTVTTLKVVSEWAADRGYLKEEVFGSSQRVARVLRRGKERIRARGLSGDSDSMIKPLSVCPTWTDIEGLASATSDVVLKRTEDEVWSLRAEAAVRVSAGTGLRMCELLELTVSDIDLDTGTIKLWRQLDRYSPAGRNRKFAPLKHRNQMKKQQFRQVIMWAKVKADVELLIENADKDGNLFPAPQKASWLADWWGTVLAEAREVSGFAWKPHWLRHHYGSYSLAPRTEGGMGISAARLQESLGHRSLETTLKTYVHATEEGNIGWAE
jgi:hypothetical protein